jgi:L-lysine 6-transaminase
MLAFDLTDHDARHALLLALREHGLLVLPCGPKGIRLRPFLDVTREDATTALDRLAETISTLA